MTIAPSWGDDRALPLVSVVTPSYNAMPYIEETIESVLSQDYPAIEHIVMDGGSTDGTVELLQRYPHLVWVSEPDRGQSHALNKGFRRARGEIIGWLNADDYYEPGAVATAVRFLKDSSDTHMVHSDLLVIDDQGDVLGRRPSAAFDLAEHLVENHIKQPTVFLRRAVIDDLGGVDERLHYVMDREFWLRIGSRYKTHYLKDRILANFRLCEGTKSYGQTPAFHAEWLRVLESRLKDSSLDNIPRATKLDALRQTRASLHFAHMLEATDLGKRVQVLRHFALAMAANWKLMFNPGTWLYLSHGVSGVPRDRLRKYHRQQRDPWAEHGQ